MRWTARLRQLWTSLPPLFRGLFLFAILVIVLINAGLRALPWTEPASRARVVTSDTFRLTIPFDRRIRESGDSWYIMFRAQERLRDRPGEPVYGPLLEQGSKFQYPPASLLISSAVTPDPRGARILNAVSWLLMWLNAALVGLILIESCKQRLPGPFFARRPQGQWILAALAAVLTLTFYPVARAMVLGQVQAWINTGIAAVIWLAMRSRWVSAGALTGLMTMVKPQYGLLVIWYALRARWGAAVAAAAVGGALTVLAVAIFGLAAHLEYAHTLSYIAARGEAMFANQSFNGLMNRLLNNGDSLRFTPHTFAPYSPLVHAVTIATTLALVVVGLVWPRGRRSNPGIEDLLIVILVATIASPIAWEHHYGVLPPIFAWALPALIRTPVLGRWTMPALGLSFILCGHFIRATRQLTGTPFSPLQSYVLWGALLLLIMLLLLRKRGAAGADSLGAPPIGPPKTLAET